MPTPSRASGHKTLDRFFYLTVWLKGLHAALEIAGGVALLFTSPEFILRAIQVLTQDEFANDPNDFVANLLLHAAENLSVSSARFAAYYLLNHGAVKLFLVAGLLRNRHWAYPALTIFDLAVMWLIWREYRLRYPTSRS